MPDRGRTMSVHRTAAEGSDCKVHVTEPPRPVTFVLGIAEHDDVR